MIKVFIGYDKRQPLAYNVLQHSIVRHSSKPVSITPLILEQLPIKRRGLTDFTFSRFLVPYLCNYEGIGIFMDADMVVTGDVSELVAEMENNSDDLVLVMKEQARFEWPSVMVFENDACQALSPTFIDDEENNPFLFTWARGMSDDSKSMPRVGSIPESWNHCVGYANPKKANLYHYTQGLPCWPETSGLPEDEVWNKEFEAMNYTVSWEELMGTSVHAKPVLQRMMSQYQAFKKQSTSAQITETADDRILRKAKSVHFQGKE